MEKSNTTFVALPSSLHFMILSTLVIITFFKRSVATDTLSISQSLSVRQTLISSGNTFELGFFSPGNLNKLYIGIWFKKIPWRRAVWVANRENPLLASDANSILAIGHDGNLKILNGSRNTIWSTNVVSSSVNSTIAVLSEKGNLILRDNVSGLTLWQSFDHPGDTFIAGMKLITNDRTGEKIVLTSWKTLDDPSRGEFELGFTTERTLQTYIRKGVKGLEPHWRSGPWDGWTFLGIHTNFGGYVNGYIMHQNYEEGSVYGTYNPPSDSEAIVEVLTPDGNFNVTRYDTKTLEVTNIRPPVIEIPCDAYGACGPFGFCNRPKSTCKCLKGFVPKLEEEWSKGNWTRGCVRRSELPCRKNGSDITRVKNDVFVKMKLMKPPDHHRYMVAENVMGCEKKCSMNCSCEAYVYVNGTGCLTWSRDLSDIQKLHAGGVDLFVRLAYYESDEDHKRIKLIIILTTLFGVIFIIVTIYCLYRCIVKRRGASSRSLLEDLWGHRINQMQSSNLPMFDFNTLLAATNNFGHENELGAGGFGPVYKGKLEDGQEIAVKRLSEHSGQGIIEFKNEILLISKLKHRNLVTLLGYCIRGDEKLLIYEYLKNKSLDNLIFDEKSHVHFDWAKRCDIIQGIARGLLYLHQDSSLRVIHRDLKASNILLDDQMNPKISDFGLARGFQMTQELEKTHRVVGTYGYMSPEYALRGLYSEKSDVFSFGVLLLEIISGMRNTSVCYQEKYLNLLGFAWHLWEENRVLDFMDTRLYNTSVSEEFIKYMQIGLLCVQDHASDRPTMSFVVLMLTSDMEISQPKQPAFYRGLIKPDRHSLSNAAISNNISLSIVEGR